MASAYIAHLGRLVEQIQDDEEDHQQIMNRHIIDSNSNSRATFHPVKVM